jgi:hypothetical protein
MIYIFNQNESINKYAIYTFNQNDLSDTQPNKIGCVFKMVKTILKIPLPAAQDVARAEVASRLALRLARPILPAGVTNEGEEGVCVICQDAIDSNGVMITVACGHVFHEKCFLDMREHNVKECPLCRAEMTYPPVHRFIVATFKPVKHIYQVPVDWNDNDIQITDDGLEYMGDYIETDSSETWNIHRRIIPSLPIPVSVSMKHTKEEDDEYIKYFEDTPGSGYNSEDSESSDTVIPSWSSMSDLIYDEEEGDDDLREGQPEVDPMDTEEFFDAEGV